MSSRQTATAATFFRRPLIVKRRSACSSSLSCCSATLRKRWLISTHRTFGARYVYSQSFEFVADCCIFLDHGTELDATCSSDLRIVRIYAPEYAPAYNVGYASVNKSLKGKWASLACHETGSLVVQVYAILLSDYFVPDVLIVSRSTPLKISNNRQRTVSSKNY